VVVGIGVFFVAFRPPLLPEDRRYIAAPGPAFDAVLPDLGRWLKKVFWVMGGYMIATGILTIHLALFVVRGGFGDCMGYRRGRRRGVSRVDGGGQFPPPFGLSVGLAGPRIAMGVRSDPRGMRRLSQDVAS